MNKLFEPISKHLSLDKTKEAALKRLGVETVIDLLLYKPISYKQKRLYPDLKTLAHGDEVIIKVEVKEIEYPARKTSPTKIFVSNETGAVTLTFFKFHSYLKSYYKIGNKLTLAGKVEFFDYRAQISHPEVIFDSALPKSRDDVFIEPRYGLTYAITNSQVRNYIAKALPLAKDIPEWLPDELLKEYNLPSFYGALCEIHGVDAPRDDALATANLRLKIDEAISNQLGFKYIKEQTIAQKGKSFKNNNELKQRVINRLGFELTQDQQDVIAEIELDQLNEMQMLRMVQGDVGCGKTIVAILTALNVIGAGYQAAIMVPTEVLATQHYNSALQLLSEIGLNVQLLTGKILGKNRKEVLDSIESGEANFIVGTHALFQENVKFKNLGYIIVDEQHRFGVNQRMELIAKGEHPDVLIMSATPIPRSLSLTMFGDLAISKIQTMPKSRKPVSTLVAPINKLEDVYKSVSSKIEKDEKVFWICPLIENTEEKNQFEYIDVETRFQELKLRFGDKVGFLHGQIKPDEKNNIIGSLRDGAINILVATTVIEVGIDIPDATLIVIENSEKFGLAQLHQLRGRVGRGSLESMCLMLYGKFTSKIAFERMKIMKESHDGFYIAEQDLKLRGEGDLLGEKQSGEQNFKFLDISQDSNIITTCHNIAKRLTIDDSKKLQLMIYNKNVTTKVIVA